MEKKKTYLPILTTILIIVGAYLFMKYLSNNMMEDNAKKKVTIDFVEITASMQKNLPCDIDSGITIQNVMFINNMIYFKYLIDDDIVENLDTVTFKNQLAKNLQKVENGKGIKYLIDNNISIYYEIYNREWITQYIIVLSPLDLEKSLKMPDN